jgi:peroxidase
MFLGGGTVNKQYSRMVPADYCDGQNSLRCAADKSPLVNARDVSLFLKEKMPPAERINKSRTNLLTAFGQFNTHVVVKTPDLSGVGEKCTCGSTDDKCFEAVVKESDPVMNVDCIFLSRSMATVKMVDEVPVREQVNQLTGLLQAGTIYGFNERHTGALREFGSGKDLF